MPSIDTRVGDTRRDPRALLVLMVALLALRIGVTGWEQRHPPVASDLVHWVSLARAEGLSRRTGKPILYDFTADWCEPCQAMQREVFYSPHRARLVDNTLVPARVLDRRREEGRNSAAVDSLQGTFGVVAFPTLVIYAPASGRHYRQEGFAGADSTERWIETAVLRERMGALTSPASRRP